MDNLFMVISTDQYETVHVRAFRKNNFIENTKNKIVLTRDKIRYHVIVTSRRSFGLNEIKYFVKQYIEIQQMIKDKR